MRRILILVTIFLICTGCAPRKMYYWGNYEDELDTYYKSPRAPEDHQRYMENLSRIIEESKTSGLIVPPGIFADYGYGLYQSGHYEDAIQSFEKEKSNWPEAVPLMDRMIGNVRTIMAKKNTDS